MVFQSNLTLTFLNVLIIFQVELESTVEHPFFVYGRGWASFRPERTLAQYGLHVQRLQVGDVCVSLVPRKHAPSSAPPQTHPENLSVKEDARKRRWSASDVFEDIPPHKKRWTVDTVPGACRTIIIVLWSPSLQRPLELSYQLCLCSINVRSNWLPQWTDMRDYELICSFCSNPLATTVRLWYSIREL